MAFHLKSTARGGEATNRIVRRIKTDEEYSACKSKTAILFAIFNGNMSLHWLAYKISKNPRRWGHLFEEYKEIDPRVTDDFGSFQEWVQENQDVLKDIPDSENPEIEWKEAETT